MTLCGWGLEAKEEKTGGSIAIGDDRDDQMDCRAANDGTSRTSNACYIRIGAK
jgi:hypothetical protein